MSDDTMSDDTMSDDDTGVNVFHGVSL